MNDKQKIAHYERVLGRIAYELGEQYPVPAQIAQRALEKGQS